MITHEQKNELRHIVLGVLAIRHPAALSLRQIHNRAAMEVDFKIEESDVLSAVEVLATSEKPLATKTKDELGVKVFWFATAAGLIAHERAEAQ